MLARLALALCVVVAPMHAQRAAEHAARGRALLDSGKTDAAIKAFEQAVKLDERNAPYRVLLAEALGRTARSANVLRQPGIARRVKSELERARALDPNYLDARIGLVQFYVQAPGIMGGGESKARAEAESIAVRNRPWGRYARAQIALDKRDTIGAEREFRAGIADDPDSLVAVTQLVNFLLSRRRGADALAAAESFLARRPDEPMAHYQVGRVAAASGEGLARGEAALRRYLTFPADSTDPTRAPRAGAHLRLGEILARRGDKEGARAEFNEALRLNPSLEAARRGLKALE